MSAISLVSQISERATEQRDVLGATTGRFLRFATLGLALVLPLVAVPGLEQPFSRPKLILWTTVVLCGLVSCARDISDAWSRVPQHLRVALALWVGALASSVLWGKFASVDDLLLPLIGVGWFVLLLTARPDARRLSLALVLSGAVVAALALLQFFHADPFAALGWVLASNGSSRMLVFATLGNPDFVAAFLAGLLPLTLSMASGSARYRWVFLGL